MIRRSVLATKLQDFEDNITYLQNEDPSIQIKVKSRNNIKFGSKIQIESNDLVIITQRLKKDEILISVSQFIDGVFQEEYFEFFNFKKKNIENFFKSIPFEGIEKRIIILDTKMLISQYYEILKSSLKEG